MNASVLRRAVAAAVFAFGCAALIAGPARAQDPPKLSGYNAAISESSISGISSGAFMAVQFGTAWSSVIKGVGVVAGGPYWCAKANGFFGYWFSFYTATGPCMSGAAFRPQRLFRQGRRQIGFRRYRSRAVREPAKDIHLPRL
jgi:hypothetical protein